MFLPAIQSAAPQNKIYFEVYQKVKEKKCSGFE